MRGRRARDAHMHLGGAGVAHHLDDLLRGGAAHDAESSTRTRACRSSVRAVGVVLQLHAEMADVVGRLDEGAADIVVADDAELEGDAGACGIADAPPARRSRAPGSTTSAATGALARQLGADALARLVDAACLRRCCRAARNRYIRRCRSAAARGANGRSEWTPSLSITTISPGSTSRTKSAPMMSRAQVSEARM